MWRCGDVSMCRCPDALDLIGNGLRADLDHWLGRWHPLGSERSHPQPAPPTRVRPQPLPFRSLVQPASKQTDGRERRSQ